MAFGFEVGNSLRRPPLQIARNLPMFLQRIFKRLATPLRSPRTLPPTHLLRKYPYEGYFPQTFDFSPQTLRCDAPNLTSFFQNQISRYSIHFRNCVRTKNAAAGGSKTRPFPFALRAHALLTQQFLQLPPLPSLPCPILRNPRLAASRTRRLVSALPPDTPMRKKAPP